MKYLTVNFQMKLYVLQILGNIYMHIWEDFLIPKTISKYPTNGKKKHICILSEHLVDILTKFA